MNKISTRNTFPNTAWRLALLLLIGIGGASTASAAGLNGSGDQFWSQYSGGMLDEPELGDRFGHALAIADFNGDGYDDLAVGIPFEKVSGYANAGAVHIIYGSEDRLSSLNNQFWHQDSPGIKGVCETGDVFGYALAAGDFNKDGFDDLAIGVPREEYDGLNRTGYVNVLYGEAGGLTDVGDQGWSQGMAGMGSSCGASDYFGETLAVGDFNNDGFDDLAIGAPMDDESGAESSGAVHILYGSENKLTTTGCQVWHQGLFFIPGEAEWGDCFGQALAAGDFDHDGVDDLAIGVPFESIASNSIYQAGCVHVLFGTEDDGITGGGNQMWTQNSPGMGSTADAKEHFGRSLAAGDFDDDEIDDLAIGAPGENNRRGCAFILFGTEGGPSAAGSWIENKSAAQDDDEFGWSLAAGDFDINGCDDLAIGVPGANDKSGTVNVVYGRNTLSLFAKSHEVWRQGSGGIIGTPQDEDRFGRALATGDFNGDGIDDLAVGVPHEDIYVKDIGNISDAGGVNIIYGAICYDFEKMGLMKLMAYLRDKRRRNSEFRIVQARNGQNSVAPRHHQFSDACSFFSIAPIVEHLGYSHFVPLSSLIDEFHYCLPSGPVHDPLDFDVGYFGSAEHLITRYIHWECYKNGAENFPEGFFNSDGTDLNWDDDPEYDCGYYFHFDPVDPLQYGFCRNFPDDPVYMWLRYIMTGCGSINCLCDPHATCMLFYFLNDRLQAGDIAGCNDARLFQPTEAAHVDDMRRIIKAFVDANMPLMASFGTGGHFMVIIGYADLDTAGLPETAIAVNPVCQEQMPDSRYMILPEINDFDNWNVWGNCHLKSLIPWNQNLDEGCGTSGWADTLDASLADPAFSICSPNWAGWSLDCVDRFFGINIICEDDGMEAKSWFRYPESPFVAESSNIDCDKVEVVYADGEREVVSAVAERYKYNISIEKWTKISTYSPDSYQYGTGSDNRGPWSRITWDANWTDDYWIVAQDLGGTDTKRRTTITLELDDGEEIVIEVAPPKTYGIEVRCFLWYYDVATYFSEADVEVFQNTNFFLEDFNEMCGKVTVRVNLGAGTTVSGTDAKISRWTYDMDNAPLEWNQVGGYWSPDSISEVDDGLSGQTMEFVWDASWPDNELFVAHDIGVPLSDIKTVIHFNTSQGIREVQIVPY